jgi:transglutaminase-like putative cysteine protease
LRYRVHHATTYGYGASVDLASHMLHLRPRVLPGQNVLRAAITAHPSPERVVEGHDHFGNQVAWLFLEREHADFCVTLDALVDVDFSTPPEPATTLGWERVVALVAAGGAPSWREAEFVFGSPMAPVDRLAGAWAAKDFPPDRPVLEGLLALNARFRSEFVFRPGVTHLHTSVGEVLRRREGVCQDFTHLMISGLRALGLPARYVSGYLRTRPPPDGVRRLGADQSHAWVAAWLGPDHGWVMLDPTNDLLVRNEHVVLGWGRDYGDVSPVRGVILGGGEHTVSVSVEMEPIEV